MEESNKKNELEKQNYLKPRNVEVDISRSAKEDPCSATIAKALDISQETVPKARAKEKKVGTEAKVKEKTRKQDFKAHTKKEKEKVGRVRPPGAGYVEAVTMQQTASKAKA